MVSLLARCVIGLGLAALLAGAPIGAARAQQSPEPPPAAAPPAPQLEAPRTDQQSDQATANSTGETVELTAQPAATFEGRADRDDVYNSIMGSLRLIRGEIDKAGLKATGHPIAIFLEADDTGFKYRAEIPLESAPEGKTELSAAVKIGLTPAAKAMRFEHRGAYDDIDATYDAITAYLDEKGIDAQDIFLEQYLNDVKTSDDPTLQVDIFVLLK
jgi:effector-binding domain-containing protein